MFLKRALIINFDWLDISLNGKTDSCYITCNLTLK